MTVTRDYTNLNRHQLLIQNMFQNNSCLVTINMRLFHRSSLPLYLFPFNLSTQDNDYQADNACTICIKELL